MNNDDIRHHLHQQYATERNLQIRILTHQKYTIPQVDFANWVLDQIEWHNTETVIDVGCGNGSYETAVRQRCRHYIAGDLSFGMLASLNTAGTNRVNLDVHRLPFADGTADVVLANHMLYYVNLSQAPAEIYRVLRPGGCLLAATNSQHTLVELGELQGQLLQRWGLAGIVLPEREALSFTLENGAAFLGRHFDQVTRIDLPSALVFTDPQPLIDYIGTMRERFAPLAEYGITWSDISAELQQELSKQIRIRGQFRVSKLTGAFICRKK